MKILITGGTGLVGKKLGSALVDKGHEVHLLSRSTVTAKGEIGFPAKIFEWNGSSDSFPSDSLNGVNAVINLAGESIGDGRWSEKRKKSIYSSRIEYTKNLSKAIKLNGETVETFISASAIGFYGNRGNEVLTEQSQRGTGFLADVCQDWEQAVDFNKRIVNLRIGIVLSRQGGALDKMLPLFTTGLGSPIGSGSQFMSWIHIDDLVSMIIFSLENKNVSGKINATAPNPVTNKIFSKKLAESLHRPMFLPVPGFVLKVVLGQMSDLVLHSQNVSSEKIKSLGFRFKYENIVDAFKEISSVLQKNQKEIYAEQWVPQTPEEIFPYFCDEKNLEKLTPDFLNFKVLDKSTKEIQEGTLIRYKLSVHGIPMRWKTLIRDWIPGKKFVDTQLSGPYQQWIHTHEFIPYAGGTLMRDQVLYRAPLGNLGDIVAGFFIKKDVSMIFKYRRKIIVNTFYK